MTIETFGAPTLDSSAIQADGTLGKARGQSVRFYKRTDTHFRAVINEEKVKQDMLSPHTKIDLKSGLPMSCLDKKTGMLPREPYDIEVLYVRIETPGDKTIYDDIATSYHKSEFSTQYKGYLEGRGIPDGQRLEQFDFISPTTLIELRRNGIFIIEQLAECSDVLCTMIPEAWDLRDYAKRWMAANSTESLKAETSRLKNENQVLKRENSEMKSQIVSASGASIMMPSAIDIEETPRESVKTKEISIEEFNGEKSKGKVK